VGSPEFVEIAIGRVLRVAGLAPAPLGVVKVPFSQRLRFLVSGTVETYVAEDGGTRVRMHTPQLRNLPLRLLDRVLKDPRP